MIGIGFTLIAFVLGIATLYLLRDRGHRCTCHTCGRKLWSDDISKHQAMHTAKNEPTRITIP